MSSQYIPVALRQLVFDRACGLCEYCRSQAKYSTDPLVMDPIYPVSRGGQTIVDNLALSCQTCNNYKYTKVEAIDPVMEQLAPLFHPRQDQWTEHFHLGDDGQIKSLSVIGRVTSKPLRFNMPSQIAARRQWAKLGLYP